MEKTIKKFNQFMNESVESNKFTTTDSYICINTTQYDGGRDKALVQSFNLNDADKLGFTYDDIKDMEIGGIRNDFDYEGVIVIRVK